MNWMPCDNGYRSDNWVMEVSPDPKHIFSHLRLESMHGNVRISNIRGRTPDEFGDEAEQRISILRCML